MGHYWVRIQLALLRLPRLCYPEPAAPAHVVHSLRAAVGAIVGMVEAVVAAVHYT